VVTVKCISNHQYHAILLKNQININFEKMNPTFLMEKPHIFMWRITVINKKSFAWLAFSVNNILLNLEIDLTKLEICKYYLSK